MSEAERLADLLECSMSRDISTEVKAAAELRRLSAENTEWTETVARADARIVALNSENVKLSAELEECQAQRRAAFRRIEEQDAELEKVRKDAERFDFVTCACEVFLDGVQIGSNEELDAAMKGTP